MVQKKNIIARQSWLTLLLAINENCCRNQISLGYVIIIVSLIWPANKAIIAHGICYYNCQSNLAKWPCNLKIFIYFIFYFYIRLPHDRTRQRHHYCCSHVFFDSSGSRWLVSSLGTEISRVPDSSWDRAASSELCFSSRLEAWILLQQWWDVTPVSL